MLPTEGKFDNIAIDYSWSFADKTQKDTAYITHGYYTYPAKFIPQLAARLIEENSNKNDTVIDPFLGSGTTVIEAIMHNRRGIGTDINEIATLAAKVKTTPIHFSVLLNEYSLIEQDLMKRTNGEFDRFVKEALDTIPNNERIDYWFLPQQKEKLAVILQRVFEIKNQDVKNFFSLAFAQILKSCSIWMQKSVKPTRDKNKKIYNPFTLFLAQSKKMLDRHSVFNMRMI